MRRKSEENSLIKLPALDVEIVGGLNDEVRWPWGMISELEQDHFLHEIPCILVVIITILMIWHLHKLLGPMPHSYSSRGQSVASLWKTVGKRFLSTA